MDDNRKPDLLKQFIDFTGIDESRAKFHLESAAWDIELALANYYESAEADGSSDPVGDILDQPPSPPADLPPTRRQFGHINVGSADSDEEGQEFYVGGSATSGQQVVGPGKKRTNHIVDSIFKSAKEHGAETVETHSPTKGQTAFRGTGHRLGDTDEPSDVIPGAASPESNMFGVVLRLWTNGFTVNDGPIRDYNDDVNKNFLVSVQKGEVPIELLKLAKGKEVSLDMEDHRTEEYKPKNKPVAAFTGQGHILGSPAPIVTSTPTQPPVGATAAGLSLSIDNSRPVTSIQIRLADGTRLVSKFNHSHTVADIRHFIRSSRLEYTTRNFTLQTTFPNKELTDDNQTIEDAKLLNAVIMQRLQ